MPAADVEGIGRPSPSKLEIQVLEKFKKFDGKYADARKEARSPIKRLAETKKGHREAINTRTKVGNASPRRCTFFKGIVVQW